MRKRSLVFSIFFVGFFICLVIYLVNTGKNISIEIVKDKILINAPSRGVMHYAPTTRVKVIRVVDGDTIEIEGGEKVRFIGMNTPETADPRRPVQCFGKEAKEKNRELVEGKEVKLIKDVSDKDKYGRLLRYVYVGNVFVNLELVREGYARVSTYPPDVKYKDEFLEAEREALEKSLGLWKSCQN